MIDARRLEVYTAMYDFEGNEIIPVEAKVLDTSSFSDILNKTEIAFMGDGMPKMKELSPLDDNRRIWLDDIYASAQNLAELSEQAFKEGRFANVAYYEPFYLKDFVGGKKIT